MWPLTRRNSLPPKDVCACCGRPIPETEPFYRVFQQPYCIPCCGDLAERAAHEDEPGGDKSIRAYKSA